MSALTNHLRGGRDITIPCSVVQYVRQAHGVSDTQDVRASLASLPRCLSVCLSVCLSACLSSGVGDGPSEPVKPRDQHGVAACVCWWREMGKPLHVSSLGHGEFVITIIIIIIIIVARLLVTVPVNKGGSLPAAYSRRAERIHAYARSIPHPARRSTGRASPGGFARLFLDERVREHARVQRAVFSVQCAVCSVQCVCCKTSPSWTNLAHGSLEPVDWS
ncbi:hypothetical protein LZ30DRAFT_225163 [Colletotrichum cereale]|nr:hypothetical protein LZ30DRAFT_225163 [Colletotrichum cereale]